MEIRLRHISNIRAIDPDAALLHIVKAAKQANQRAFARPCRPYNTNHFTWLDMKFQIVNDRYILLISKMHMVEMNTSLNIRQRNAAYASSLSATSGPNGEDIPDAIHRNRRGLQRIPLLGNGIDRLEKLPNVRDKRVEHTEFNAFIKNSNTSDPSNKGNRQITQNIKGTIKHHIRTNFPQVGVEIAEIPIREAIHLLLLLMKSLDQMHTG